MYLSGVFRGGNIHTPFSTLKVEVLKSDSLGLTSWSFCGCLLFSFYFRHLLHSSLTYFMLPWNISSTFIDPILWYTGTVDT